MYGLNGLPVQFSMFDSNDDENIERDEEKGLEN